MAGDCVGCLRIYRFGMGVGIVLTLYKRTIINPFVPNAPFLYPLKTSENLKVF